MEKCFFWQIVEAEVKKQNTSFDWLCRKTKIPKGTFSSWRSRNTLPGVDSAFLIAQALNVPVEYLLTGLAKNRDFEKSRIYDIQYVASMLACFDDVDRDAVKKLVETLYSRYIKFSETEKSPHLIG